MPPESLTLIERYGSFGLMCVLFLSGITGVGVFFLWFTRVGFPQMLAFFQAMQEEHKKERQADSEQCKEERERKEAEHKAERERDSTAHVEAMGKVVAAVEKLGERVEGNGQRIDRIEDWLDGAPARQAKRGG